jgi:hypothetical protein
MLVTKTPLSLASLALDRPFTASPLEIDSTGKLGTMLSSRRFKRHIKPMDSASEAILALKPVTFHYKATLKTHPALA